MSMVELPVDPELPVGVTVERKPEAVLNSEMPLPEGVPAYCSKTGCPEPATHIWPGPTFVKKGEKVGLWCKTHLDRAKEHLAMALGR